MANLCTSINLQVIHQARNQDVPEGDTVGNLHILWQTDSHCPTLAGSGEFTKCFLFQMLCNYKMRCKREGEGNGIIGGVTYLHSTHKVGEQCPGYFCILVMQIAINSNSKFISETELYYKNNCSYVLESQGHIEVIKRVFFGSARCAQYGMNGNF